MKIKNIFYIAVSTLFLNSCATVETIDPSEVRSSIRDRTKVSKPKKSSKPRKLKVATILPLTGKNSKIGKSMLNAINLSLFDNDKKNRVELVIFDNKSSDYTSKRIMEEVVDKNIKLVVGPIFTNSVEAVSQIAIDNNIVIISFSNNSDLANHKGIFLAGFSPEQEIDRITSYLIDSGKSNFSIIAPNNQYGIRISKTLREMVEIKDANFVASQFYIRSKKDFSKIANNILRSYIVSKDVDQYKEELEQIEDKKEREARELEIISEHKIYVDTVLIADSSNKAGRIAKEIRDHNFDGRDIRIIGTSHWDKDLIFSNPNLSNSLFAGPNGKYYEKFKQKYQNVYKKDPIRISSIAYDVTAFVIDLVDDLKGKRPTSNAITFYNGKKGYRGIDGLFRFLPNGIAQRNLSVLQINNGSFRIIDRAQRRFLNY